jgi:hypothetical protein
LETLRHLQSRLELRPVRGTTLIDIGVFSEVREETAELANAIAESYVNYRSTRSRALNEQRKQTGFDANELIAAQRQFQALIVETAKPPLHPARPNRPMNIALGAVAGVFLGGLVGLIAGLIAWGKQQAPGVRPAKLIDPALTATTQRHGRAALGLFLAGTLGTLLLMTISHRHELALIFGGVALVLALIFGVMSWQARLGKGVVIAALALFTGLGIGVAILSAVWVLPGKREAAAEHQLELFKRVEAVRVQERGRQQGKLSFGPILEQVLHPVASGQANCIDFDRGEVGDLPSALETNYALKYEWMAERGFDALVWRQEGLECPGMTTANATPADWDSLPATVVADRLENAEKLDAPALQTWGKLPATWVFRTREGASGLLQITGFTDNPRGVKLRYKLVQNPASRTLEPSCQGRSLLDWLSEVAYDAPSEKRGRAGEAIRQMGLNVIPYLLTDLGDSNPQQLKYARADVRSADERMSQATWAFDALGPLGKPAIPQLVKLLEVSPGYAPCALAGIGRDALPELLTALTNDVFWVRDNTAACLANAIYRGKISGLDALPAWPIAWKNLDYTNSTNSLYEANTRHRAAALLDAIRSDPALNLPDPKSIAR